EVDTDQDGTMPACIWSQQDEVVFIKNFLGPALQNDSLDTKIWILDHNYNLWGSVLAQLTDADVETDWSAWSHTFSDVLRNWARCIVGWNLALDEKGTPNKGLGTAGGIVTIHSETQKITRCGQYWAFAHYSKVIQRGA